jgi:peptidoglycan-associated lipoprotein
MAEVVHPHRVSVFHGGDIMTGRRLSLLPVLVLSLFIAYVGCAKRPSVTVASAPAPTAPAPAPAPAPAAPAPAPAPPPVAAAPAPEPAPAPAPTARPAPPPSEFMPNDNLKPIHFDFDKADIRKSDAEILTASARWLADNPANLVLIEGHCDERGTNEYNLALGERRAKAAMNFLAARGIAASRMTIISYGEERPLCRDSNEKCWAENRRGMFLTKSQ